MRAAFVRQGVTSTFWTWKSLRYPGPEKLLDEFVFKSKTFSLAVEFEADVWIVEGNTPIGGTFLSMSGNEYVEGIMKRHEAVPMSAVPWGEYDVAVSVLPFVPDKIIGKHPDVLWCYFPLGHTSRMFRRSRERPYGKYDLFLNHFAIEGELKRLPQSVPFPFPTNPDLMRRLVKPTNEPAVFLDTRLTKREPLSWFAKRCPLPVKCAPEPASSGRKVLTGKFTKTKEYLESVGSCKYFLLSRKPNFVGQAMLEGAALGLIVVSGPGCYASALCHPECLVEPNDLRQGLGAVKKIEKDSGLQEEILRHQDKVLRDVFWERPLNVLRKALKMKRREI